MPGPAPRREFALAPLTRPWFADPRHGPLPALLLLLTVNTGVIDAVSILSLGRVFVANMTGNVVFVGFAVAGAPGFSLSASLWALGGFVVGAYSGGLVANRLGQDRGKLFAITVLVEAILFAAILAVSIGSGHTLNGTENDSIAAVAALALGLQNAVVRKLAVPDLTTTVLTMTLTGIAADVTTTGRSITMARRILAVLAMLGGAIGGAALVLHAGRTAALAAALGLVVVTAAGATVAAQGHRVWHQSPVKN
ncbi:MAG: hypothetical protein JWN95_2336 [Frankiales bacterium]|nr:hypothetical protein [Frankiales bacterium]